MSPPRRPAPRAASMPPDGPTPVDWSRLAAARLRLLSERSGAPWLAAAAFALVPVARPGTGVFAGDRRWRLFVDPARLAEMTTLEVAARLHHLIDHLLLDHATRAEHAEVRIRTLGSWLEAADGEVAGSGRAEALWRPAVSLTAPPRPEQDCGSAAGGPLRDFEVQGELERPELAGGPLRDFEVQGELERPELAGAPPPPGLDPSAAASLRRSVAADVVAALNARKDVGVLASWASGLLAPRADWRRELGSFVRAALGAAAGAVDYSWARPARRPPLGDVLRPALVAPELRVAVVADTSGSMAGRAGALCQEVMGIVVAAGQRPVQVLAVDDEVRAVSAVTGARRPLLVGGGWTDMAAGLAAASALSPRPDVVVVLTDGLTAWGARPHGTKVIVGLIGAAPDSEAVPSWAKAVHIQDEG